MTSLTLTPSDTKTTVTDWSLCVICQASSDDELLDPTKNPIAANRYTGYRTLATNIQILNDLDSLPLLINIARLDDGSGIANTLTRNIAKWHKSCYSSCNKTHIDRVRKRKAEHFTEIHSKHHTPVKNKLRRSSSFDNSDQTLCFICDKPISKGQNYQYHRAQTLNVGSNVSYMATCVSDTKLESKLTSGDLPAKDAHYHKSCLTNLHTRYRSYLRQRVTTQQSDDVTPEAVALAELVAYIEDVHQCDDNPHTIFKLHDLVDLYKQRIRQLTGDEPRYIHATRIKDKLIALVPGLEVNKSKSNDVIISFKDDIADALLSNSQFNKDSDAVTLMRAAQIVRGKLFQAKNSFSGSLIDSDYSSLPSSLVALVQLLLCGTNIKSLSSSNTNMKNAISSISQLISFNAVKRVHKDSVTVRHDPDRETPLPLYMGLLIHAKTRKRDLIDIMFERGISVSYRRVMQVSTVEANKVIDQYNRDGVVCPTALKHGLFTTGNLDNIDHNPSSTSAQDAFHGTALSLSQHTTHDNSGITRVHNETVIEQSESRTVKQLPDEYTYVPPAQFPTEKPTPCETYRTVPSDNTPLGVDETQHQWLTTVLELTNKHELDKNANISWSAYFANTQQSVPRPPAITSMMPMFRDSAHTLGMVKHGMDLIRKSTEHVNPGQTPVITLDQPLFALAKKVQWSWSSIYGADKYIVLLGGLHIEMATLSVMGDWLEGSGWTAMLANANVTTEGRAESLQRGSDIARAQWAHQITAAALFILQMQSYTTAKDAASATRLPFPDWCKEMERKFPQFCYWSKTLQLELLFLQFLRSQREGNFQLYVDSLQQLLPWVFALDHYHYARWLSVHVADLLQLEVTSPSTFVEFRKGHFVTQKSNRKFSLIAHDQIHEQLNAVIKGDGGAIGITEHEDALRRWMVAGPEITAILHEYQESNKSQTVDHRHHEQTPSRQTAFATGVTSMARVIDEMGNPFADESGELYSLDRKVIMQDDVVKSVRTIEEVGKAQYQHFKDNRLTGNETAFYDTISKNNLPLFKSTQKKMSKTKTKLSNMKTDVELFSRMYISCQTRDGNLSTFFEHENHSWPPSLATDNMLKQGNKSDLVECLESLAPRPIETPVVDVKIIDGAALVHALDPKKSTASVKSFSGYAERVFMPYIQRELRNCKRLDVVWDVYEKNSLKAHIRQSRGEGLALRVAGNTSMPRNWANFLRVDSNKTGLFAYLASEIKCSSVPEGKLLLSTDGENVLSSSEMDVSGIDRCTHEEADYRMLLHASHAYQQGYSRILIRATDTDVLVLAVEAASVLDGCELWLAFGHGTRFRYIPAHAIAAALGPERSSGLLFLHAVSGCDTVSFIHGVGKKTAWQVWRSLPQLGTLFHKLSHTPASVSASDMAELERYFVLLYSRTATWNTVNDARQHMFAQGNRKLDNIPPTAGALEQHVKRAAYQAGHVWGQAFIPTPILPSPENWGWTNEADGSWSPMWTSLPEASEACRELIKCRCKKGCSGRCKCAKASLPCTQLCLCLGMCSHD